MRSATQPVGQRRERLGLEVGGYPEVQDHDSTIPIHQDIGRLQITMDLSARVEGHETLAELAQRLTQPPFVEVLSP